jgi:hypothetical protein
VSCSADARLWGLLACPAQRLPACWPDARLWGSTATAGWCRRPTTPREGWARDGTITRAGGRRRPTRRRRRRDGGLNGRLPPCRGPSAPEPASPGWRRLLRYGTPALPLSVKWSPSSGRRRPRCLAAACLAGTPGLLPAHTALLTIRAGQPYGPYAAQAGAPEAKKALLPPLLHRRVHQQQLALWNVFPPFGTHA